MPKLFAALTLLVALVACAKTPTEAGTALGAEHVALVRSGELTYDRFAEDLEEGTEAYAAEADREAFRDAYLRAVEPEKAKIAALYVAYAADMAGEAIGDAMEAFGRGFGRMAGGFVDGIRRVASDEVEEEKSKSLKELGRRIGRTVKSIGEDLEEVAEGIEEGLKD